MAEKNMPTERLWLDGHSAVWLFNFRCVVKRNPSRAGFQPAPASRGTLPGFDLHDGKYAFSCKLTGLGIVRSRPFADIQVRNADLDKKTAHLRTAQKQPRPAVDIDPVIVEHAVTWVAVGTPLGVG